MLKRFLRWFGVTVLMLSLSPAAKASGQEWREPSAGDTLARAVQQTPRCAPQTARWDVAEGGERVKVTSEQSESGVAALLRLDFLFKPGRFELTLEKEEVVDGRTLRTIAFAPKPESEHVGMPRGSSYEARSINWAMNRMSGKVTLDRKTGGIVRITGEAPYSKARKFGFWTAELFTLQFTHEQRLVGEAWQPLRTTTLLHYAAMFKSAQHSFYEIAYHCDVSTQF
jgi:hypothetical protein